MNISTRVMGRLARYRALLTEHFPAGKTHVFSHDLAALMGLSSSQVRRDLMGLGYYGVPRYGYEISELVRHINQLLDASTVHNVAVVGVGNLGRALMAYLGARRPGLRIVAAFDDDPAKTDRVIHGVPCHPIGKVEEVVGREDIRIAVLCLPGGAAQRVTDTLVHAGVKGFLNFAPVPIRVPHGIVMEEIDLTSTLERVAFYTNKRANAPKEKRHADR